MNSLAAHLCLSRTTLSNSRLPTELRVELELKPKLESQVEAIIVSFSFPSVFGFTLSAAPPCFQLNEHPGLRVPLPLPALPSLHSTPLPLPLIEP